MLLPTAVVEVPEKIQRGSLVGLSWLGKISTKTVCAWDCSKETKESAETTNAAKRRQLKARLPIVRIVFS